MPYQRFIELGIFKCIKAAQSYFRIINQLIINMKNVGVFVYGDIGRSPRMQNHAAQLSKQYQVYFMGYCETSPKTHIIQNPNIKLVDLQIRNLQYFRKISFYLYAFVRIILQILQILYLLCFKLRNLQFVLVQNPPSIPNLFAIWLASFFGKFKIFIDFHNYGYTILNLSVKNKIILKFATFYQKFFARKANGFLCVSDRMKGDLKDNWNIDAITLYDRPLTSDVKIIEKKAFLKKYGQRDIEGNQLLLVSSTSWTKDEDFSILLEALQSYNNNPYTKTNLRVFITGKGPQKERYLEEVGRKRQKWTKISVTALWLQADDYPLLLSICDLGICLHYSSSGLDLPMKVVDMFGAGIPVLAIDFPALPQLLKDGKTGFIFDSKQQLAKQLVQISDNTFILKAMKKDVRKEASWTWSQEWSKKFRFLL